MSSVDGAAGGDTHALFVMLRLEKQALIQCLIAQMMDVGNFISHANGCTGVLQMHTLISDLATKKHGGEMACLLCICYSKLECDFLTQGTNFNGDQNSPE